MFSSENALKKWAPLLEHSDCAPISDPYRKAVTAVLLENQEKAMREQAAHSSFQINEANDTVAVDDAEYCETSRYPWAKMYDSNHSASTAFFYCTRLSSIVILS